MRSHVSWIFFPWIYDCRDGYALAQMEYLDYLE